MIPLYTKYRPQTFEDMTEQKEVIDILKNQIATNTVRNCYLFTGFSGVGKNSTARILAREINKGVGGIVEIDSASHGGVDDMREMINRSNYQALDAEYRIFILDEVHVISPAAFSSLLKTLEEPNSKTIYMMCTTDPQKIPQTIINRVQRFDLKKISYQGIVSRLEYIVESENKEGRGIELEDGVLEYIAKTVNGGMRDAITALDKCLGLSNKISIKDAISILGAADYDTMFELFYAVYNYDSKEVIEVIERVYRDGANIKQFLKQFTNFIADICKYKLFENYDYIGIPQYYADKLERTKLCEEQVLKQLLDSINEINYKVMYESRPLPVIETELLLLSS